MRLAVDAVVEHAGQLLLIEYDDARLGRHWGLPGGGVEPGEGIHDALRREVLEETGAQVVVGQLTSWPPNQPLPARATRPTPAVSSARAMGPPFALPLL